jgi:uncharacterized peroxidase-related enzyme
MWAHLWDLRAERPDLDGQRWARLEAALVVDWRGAELTPRERALCAFAERLTRDPGAMGAEHVAELRAAGLGDAGIHRAVQTIAYFNYINRVADGLEVELEPEMEPRP